MESVPVLPNEKERIKAVKSYGILDTPPEAEYDAITKLASQICGTPVSLITLLDDTRQWFKSAQGTDVKGSPREYAFCSYAILNPQEPMIVPDLRKDDRFKANPFVTEDPHVVFYAGVPLTDSDGFSLGSLCVLDVQEKLLTDFQLNSLRVLAQQVVTLMQLRRRLRTQQTFQKLLEERNEELQKTVNHLLNLQPTVNHLAQTIAALQKSPNALSIKEGQALVSDARDAILHIEAAMAKAKKEHS